MSQVECFTELFGQCTKEFLLMSPIPYIAHWDGTYHLHCDLPVIYLLHILGHKKLSIRYESTKGKYFTEKFSHSFPSSSRRYHEVVSVDQGLKPKREEIPLKLCHVRIYLNRELCMHFRNNKLVNKFLHFTNKESMIGSHFDFT